MNIYIYKIVVLSLELKSCMARLYVLFFFFLFFFAVGGLAIKVILVKEILEVLNMCFTG